MARDCRITINGTTIRARRGDLLLDAALNAGIDLPYDCRAGHCGTCCVQLVSGTVRGGAGSVPGVVHACQCRIAGDAVIAREQPTSGRTVQGVLSSVRFLASDIVEVGVRIDRALPYLAGQYAKLRFNGHPSRPFSLTHPLEGDPGPQSVWFHIRRMEGGRVTSLIGNRIRPGHPVQLSGPFGSAYFRPNLPGRLILVATNTGFAPIWSIAVSALRENPHRTIIVIVGGRTIESIYMGAALYQLSRFPNVVIVPVCSTPQTLTQAVYPGRPTDYLPQIVPSDVLYACGAPGLVESIEAFAAQAGAVCYADPFLPTADKPIAGVLPRTMEWITARTRQRVRPSTRPLLRNRRPPIQAISYQERG